MLQPVPKQIHIYLESNPNPNSLKFVVNEMLVPEGLSFDFPDVESAESAPLAKELFSYPYVDRVFYMSNFITVTKKEGVEWLEIQSIIKDHIKKFLEAGKYIIEVNDNEDPAGEEETDTVSPWCWLGECLFLYSRLYFHQIFPCEQETDRSDISGIFYPVRIH